MKLTKIAMAVALLALVATAAQSQTFKTDFGTKVVLAGGGTDPINTVTLTSAADIKYLGIAAPITLTLPDTLPGTAGFLLTVSPSGGFYWTNPALGLTLGGDVIGTAGHNTVIRASGTAFSVSHNISVGGGANITGDDTIGGTLYANGNANIDAGAPGTAGTITIGDNGNNNGTPDSSVTTINGAVNFTGPVNIPAGDLNLGLANDKFYIGSLGGIATPQTITQDVSITNGGVAAVNSASGPKFTVSGYQDVSGGQNVSGNDTIGGYQTVALNQIITGGQNVGGADTIGGTLYANGNANIDAGAPGTAGTITIGDNGNNNGTPDSSVTTINGAVNFTGPVNIPAGDLNLGLANDKFYIGSLGGIATPQTITQDVSITNGGVATVNSSNAATFEAFNKIGLGLSNSNTELANSNDNILDAWSTGERDSSIVWESSSDGYVAAFANTSTGIYGNDNNGLLVKVAHAVATTIALDVTTGTATTAGPDLFHVDGAGNVVIDPTTASTTTIGNSTSSTSLLGQTNAGSTALTNGSVPAIPALVLDGSHSYYSLTGASDVTITSITGTPAYAQGQILMLVDAGSANFTLAAGLGLNGGAVIMTPGGTATILYDGAHWHLIGAE